MLKGLIDLIHRYKLIFSEVYDKGALKYRLMRNFVINLKGKTESGGEGNDG